jgi:hypothetical protein
VVSVIEPDFITGAKSSGRCVIEGLGGLARDTEEGAAF